MKEALKDILSAWQAVIMQHVDNTVVYSFHCTHNTPIFNVHDATHTRTVRFDGLAGQLGRSAWLLRASCHTTRPTSWPSFTTLRGPGTTATGTLAGLCLVRNHQCLHVVLIYVVLCLLCCLCPLACMFLNHTTHIG